MDFRRDRLSLFQKVTQGFAFEQFRKRHKVRRSCTPTS